MADIGVKAGASEVKSDFMAEGEVYALVLAAGAGTRFGGGKLLALRGGRPLVAHAVEAALASPAAEIILVTGASASAVAEAAREAAANRPLRVVEAADWREGLSASLRAGIAALPPDAGAAIVFLGDMPDVPHALAARLVAAWREGAEAAAPVHGGRRGHPALLSRTLFGAVAELRGDRGAGALLDALGDRLALVKTDDPGVLFDVDRREDLE